MNYAFDDFDFDGSRLELRRAGRPLKADALVLRVLRALVQRPGQLVSKRELIDEVWEGRAVSENVITVAMARLRKTLAAAGDGRGQAEAVAREFIQNVHGRGYRFVQPVAERPQPLPGLVGGEPRLASRVAFVGRAAILERLRLLPREAAAGRGSVCIVMGEAGIGKTRLVEELSHDAESGGFQLAWAYCQAGHAPPLWPFAQLLAALSERVATGDAGLATTLAQLAQELSQ
ncbi:MAG TPA: winged helix-turn-helix domain-containing protein, partial [Planctomycetota bacterium]|nr:winged helix-turn-helix domain-containing protein [Planctomycetota bacterium]